MARRAAAPVPSPANQAGRSTAQLIKKLPRGIVWVTLIFVLIGTALGTALGLLLGNLGHDISPIVPTFWFWFKLGFGFGFGGLFVLYLRFSAFEDVQEGGRAFYASIGIALGAAVALRMLAPMFEGQSHLRNLAIGGIVLTAIVLVINIFMKHEYKHMVSWTALLIVTALIGLLVVNGTDGKGFELRNLNPFGGSNNATDDHTPKTVRLNPTSREESFSNLSRVLSNRFEASSRAKSFRWVLEEGSSCGVVVINDTHRVRQCPEEKDIDLRASNVLRPYENMHSLQFEGEGMAGKVTTTW